MLISLLVPYRSDDGGARDINWSWLSAYWARELPEAEVVTGDDGSVPFNRAASINRAAKEASGDILVNLDADYWCHPERLREAADLVRVNHWLWALPYTRLCRLKKNVTAQVLTEPPTVDALPGSLRGGQYYHVNELPYCSAAIYPREAWDDLGGMPESFRGWGGEDRAWACALVTLWGPMFRREGIMYHLWHPMLTPAGWAEVPAYPARHEGQTEFFEPLRKQFIAAEGNPAKMRALLTVKDSASSVVHCPSGYRQRENLQWEIFVDGFFKNTNLANSCTESDIEFITYNTRGKPGLLERSLAHLGITNVTVLGTNLSDSEFTWAHKVTLVRDYLMSGACTAPYIACLDSDDVMVLEDPKVMLDKFQAMDAEILFCRGGDYPMNDVFRKFEKETYPDVRLCHLNANYIGRTDYILVQLKQIDTTGTGFDDQLAWRSRHMLLHPEIRIDVEQTVLKEFEW